DGSSVGVVGREARGRLREKRQLDEARLLHHVPEALLPDLLIHHVLDRRQEVERPLAVELPLEAEGEQVLVVLAESHGGEDLTPSGYSMPGSKSGSVSFRIRLQTWRSSETECTDD